MVESEAKGLSEEVMLGAVVFGHQQMQVAIKAIKELRRQGRQAALELAGRRRQCGARERAGAARAGRAVARPTRSREKLARRDSSRRSRRRRCSRSPAAMRRSSPRTRSKTQFFKLESNIVRQRILNGEPRIDGRDLQDRSPDHREGRRAAAHARLGAVHARRDAGARRHDARHRRAIRRSSTRSTANAASRSCSTTTSRRSRSVRPA